MPKIDPTIPTDVAASKPEVHEQACLDAIRAQFDTDFARHLYKRPGELVSVDLDGNYPDTCAVVVMNRCEGLREYRYSVWHTVPDFEDDSVVPHPSVFGLNVAGWVLES